MKLEKQNQKRYLLLVMILIIIGILIIGAGVWFYLVKDEKFIIDDTKIKRDVKDFSSLFVGDNYNGKAIGGAMPTEKTEKKPIILYDSLNRKAIHLIDDYLDSNLAFSEASKKVAYFSFEPTGEFKEVTTEDTELREGKYEIFNLKLKLLDIDNLEVSVLAENLKTASRNILLFSSDGLNLAYISKSQSPTIFDYEISTININTLERKVFPLSIIESPFLKELIWSDDNKTIYFVGEKSNIDETDLISSIYALNLESGKYNQIIPFNNTSKSNLSLSPDGKFISYIESKFIKKIYPYIFRTHFIKTYNLETKEEKSYQVASMPTIYSPFNYAWSPNNELIYYEIHHNTSEFLPGTGPGTATEGIPVLLKKLVVFNTVSNIKKEVIMPTLGGEGKGSPQEFLRFPIPVIKSWGAFPEEIVIYNIAPPPWLSQEIPFYIYNINTGALIEFSR